MSLTHKTDLEAGLKEKNTDNSEDFPFSSAYDQLITGKTLSKRGLWWTAVLLVESKQQEETEEQEEGKKPASKKKPAEPTKKIIIQRWQKGRRKTEDNPEAAKEFWIRKKDFTLGRPAQWENLKSIIDAWVKDGSWK